MSHLSITTNNPYTSSLRIRRQAQSPTDWQDGDEVTAELTEIKDGKATLKFSDDLSLTVPAGQVQGGVGDKCTFRVSKNENGVTLKQVVKRRQQAGSSAPRGNTDMIQMTGNTINKIAETDENRYDEKKEVQAKTAAAVAKIQRAQMYMSDTAGASVLTALLDSGISLTKIDFSSFGRVLHEVRKDNTKKMSGEEMESAMERRYANRSDARDIAGSLHGHGLPVTDRNIRRLESAWERLPHKVSDGAAEKLVAEDAQLNIDELYKASHSSSGSKPQGTEETWEAPASEMEKLFKREGIEPTDENLKAAKFLERRDIPINKEGIEKLLFLQSFEENVSKTALFDKAAEYISNDRPIGSIPLYEIVSSTRLMAESQLRFSIEAAARRQDLAIDTVYIRQTVRDLVRLDEDFAKSFLNMADAEASPENVSQLRSVMNTLADIQPLTANVHPGIMRGQVRFNLNGIHESVTAGRANYDAAFSEYERFATVPSARYGDSINALRGDFAHVLEVNGIDTTADNMRAAFILSRNAMDVTGENVQAVAEIDAKINSITRGLHPMIAAQMLKDGLQPLEMHADQVLSYIKQFNREMGEGGTEAIARHIMEMDNENTLDADTREKMVAVYRMLHVIQKDGAAALGLAAKQEQDSPLTLGSLMELSKYFQNSKRPAVFDKTTEEGYLDRISRPENSIRSILERQPSAAVTRTDIIAEEFAKTANPALLGGWLAQEENLNVPLEELTGQSEQNAEQSSPANNLDSAEAQVRFFVNTPPALIHYLQSRNIPATPGAIKALQKLSGDRTVMGDALSTAEENMNAAESEGGIPLETTKLEALRNGGTVSQVIARAWANLEGQLPTEQVTAAQDILSLQNKLNGENGFSIPVRVNGKVSKLSLYVLNERAIHEDGAKVFMSLDTSSLGSVQGYLTINKGVMDLQVKTGSAAASSALEKQIGTLETLLNEAGIAMGKVEFSVEPAENSENTNAPDMPSPQQAMKRISLSAYEYLA